MRAKPFVFPESNPLQGELWVLNSSVIEFGGEEAVADLRKIGQCQSELVRADVS